MTKQQGPTLPISEEIHAMKYRLDGESFREQKSRVANALADNHDHFEAYREITLDMRFMEAGRVQSAMGSPRQVTPWNCFVSGTIGDSMDDIMQKAAEAAKTMRMGGGIGYDFSTLRPRGDRITTLDSQSSGPVSFMEIFDAVCRTISSAGHRRGAQMGVMRIDHPDIEEFIAAKTNSDRLTGFNISVAVTDQFMQAVEDEALFDLVFEGEVYKTVHAPALWEKLMRATWDWAEPGVLFIDRINEKNNLWYCETIAATNPCGEQPLPPYGACLLGSFNLVKYLKKDLAGYYFDFTQFQKDIPIVVRAMDNIIDRGAYPLPQQAEEGQNKRRMGLGVTGLANALEAMGLPYASRPFLAAMEDILRTLRDEAYRASVQLAKEKGPFPLFHPDYLKGQFIQTLPSDIRAGIEQYGIRNSHLLSIAPTGTISLSADNVSSGIEPVFSYGFDRTIITFDGPRTERVDDYGVREFDVKGRTAGSLSPMEHVAVLTLASSYVDSACSKTCNIGPMVTWEEFKEVYHAAWLGGASGCTTFRAAGKRYGVLNASKDEEVAEPPEQPKDQLVSDKDEPKACYFDPTTGQKECS